MDEIDDSPGVEEVIGNGDDIRFEPLYELEGDRAVATGRIDRGESRIVNRLAGPTEDYAAVRRAISSRTELLSTLVNDGRTSPQAVATAYTGRGDERGDLSERRDGSHRSDRRATSYQSGR